MTPPGVRVARASPERVELAGRVPREGPLLVAVALGVLGLIPLIAPGSITLLRAAGAFALLLLAAALASRSLGRRVSISIEPGSGRVSAGRARHALTDARVLVLGGGGTSDDGEPRASYRVLLELASGERLVVLEGADPAVVLGDLGRLVEHVDLPVQSGWGLPKGAEPWRRSGPRAARPSESPPPERAERMPSQRRTAVAVLGGAVFTTVAMGVMFGARLRRGDAVGALSWLLAFGTIALLYAIGLFIATDHLAIDADGERVRIVRRAFGRTRSELELRRSDVLAAFAVGPSEDELRHVVVETRAGFVSVPIAGAAATALARTLSA